MALLVVDGTESPAVPGALVDTSPGGFCARHSYGEFQPKQMVSFIHRFREGMARVIWTRRTEQGFETGFAYVDTPPRRSAT